MARTAVPVQNPKRVSGGSAAFTDITSAGGSDTANGLTVTNNGNLHLIVKTGATGETASFTVSLAGVSVDVTVPALTYTIAANSEVLIGPFPLSQYSANLLINHAQATTKVIPVYNAG